METCFLVEMVKMLINSNADAFQPNLFGTDLLQQLDPADPLLHLAAVIPWEDFNQAFSKHYTQGLGAPVRKRIGKAGVEKIFQMSIALHGRAALDRF